VSATTPKENLLDLFGSLQAQLQALQCGLESSGVPEEKVVRYIEKMKAAVQENIRFTAAELCDQAWTDAAEAGPEATRSVRHDARNLLNHLSGPVQMLIRHLREEPWSSSAARMQDTLDECLALIDSYGSGQSFLGVLHRSDEAQESVHFSPDPDGASIVVADDDPRNRESLTDVLTEMGYSVTAVEDGEAALREVATGNHDLLLLDLEMPKYTGFEVLEQLAKAGHLQHTPVLVVTGQRVVDAAVRCIALGADDFIPKPFHVELLAARVKSSLERKRLRQREFEQFFPADLAREFARHPDLRNMDGRAVDVSVLFCDIRGFSTVSEKAGPELTVRWLRGIMNRLSNLVIEHDGVLVDYAGDELFAMWGAPREFPDHADRACNAALGMLGLVEELNAEWEEIVGFKTDFGIGVNSGIALVGNIGTDRKFKYGPLGNTVNLGSRVQGATKYLRTRLLITGDTRRRLSANWDASRLRKICHVKVQNIVAPIELYQITAQPGPDWDVIRTLYEKAIHAFEEGDLARSDLAMGELFQHSPDDGPCRLLNLRVAEAMLAPEAPLDFVWTLPGK
jgi:adenylate cyclase